MKIAVRAAFISILALVMTTLAPALAADDERPTNFIFLLDVSGSMLYKSEMVPAANGQKVFLFEALRQALAQIVQDQRLLNSQSKAAVITFGTQVGEKSDWPQKVDTAEARQKLVGLINSPEQLQADKHGDTYMGGALVAALDKANQFYADSDPCTTTFVVMLTDGWDEPPHGATISVRDAAAKYLTRSKEIQKKLGVKTWQAVVIGLQDLPDRKSGTTTARELAALLNGQFIDVTKQAGGTVSEKIFGALKHTVEGLKGQIKLPDPAQDVLHHGIVDFGTIDGLGVAKASVPAALQSCYPEQITRVAESTGIATKAKLKQLFESAHSSMIEKDIAHFLPHEFSPAGQAVLVSTLPPGAITLGLAKQKVVIAPQLTKEGESSTVKQPVDLVLTAHNNCPAGHFVGTFKLDASAKVPEATLFCVSVPQRLVSDPENIVQKVKKPGLFWSEPTDSVISGSIKEAAGTHESSNYSLTITPGDGKMHGTGRPEVLTKSIAAQQINDGKPLILGSDAMQDGQIKFSFPIHIPANQDPGTYEGKVSLAVKGAADIVYPTEVPYTLHIEPSAWEEVAPIAVPTLILLVLVSIAWFVAWVKTARRLNHKLLLARQTFMFSLQPLVRNPLNKGFSPDGLKFTMVGSQLAGGLSYERKF